MTMLATATVVMVWRIARSASPSWTRNTPLIGSKTKSRKERLSNSAMTRAWLASSQSRAAPMSVYCRSLAVKRS